MDRREFLARVGLVSTWALISVSIGGCYGDDPAAPADNTEEGDVTGVVTGGGHSHGGSTITAVQLQAGGAVTLTLTGSGHTHTVALDAGEVGSIADGTRIVKISSNDGGHTHTVTFN